jgi:hypothetical protein
VLCFYLRTFDRDQLEPVRACLERSIVIEPEYSEALVACLVYSNARRFAHPNEGALGVAAGALPPEVPRLSGTTHQVVLGVAAMANAGLFPYRQSTAGPARISECARLGKMVLSLH